MKKLPDHGFLNEPEEIKELFTAKFATELAKKHGLGGREKALLANLNNAGWKYQAAQEISPPGVAEQRKLLTVVSSLAAELDNTLERLGPYELRLLHESRPETEQAYTLREMILAVHQLKYDAEWAVKALPAKPGRKPKYDQDCFVEGLYNVYTVMTGDTRAYTNYQNSSGVSFIDDCLTFLNIHTTHSNIVRVLRKSAPPS